MSPGLKVVAPATPYDAKGLLIAAFEDGNPVLFLEHKLLYRSREGPGSRRASTPCRWAGRAWRAEGRDATIVTYGVGRGLGARGRGAHGARTEGRSR